MTENKQLGRIALTEQEKKIRDDEGYKTYQKNISERKKNGEELTIMNKSEWIKSKPSGESPSVKFTRLAKKRMSVTLSNMDTIINLSSGQYKATPEQIKKMVDTLKDKITAIENAFGKVKPESEKGFDF